MFWDELRLWFAKGVAVALGGMTVVAFVLLLAGIGWAIVMGIDALRGKRRPW